MISGCSKISEWLGLRESAAAREQNKCGRKSKCLIGIYILAYDNPYIMGSIIPYIQQTTRVLVTFWSLLKLPDKLLKTHIGVGGSGGGDRVLPCLSLLMLFIILLWWWWWWRWWCGPCCFESTAPRAKETCKALRLFQPTSWRSLRNQSVANPLALAGAQCFKNNMNENKGLCRYWRVRGVKNEMNHITYDIITKNFRYLKWRYWTL